ncbi:MAG TPA: CocE/NonD family hydrolase [Mycobacteriales bacterium]|nr:CocE/NonD family hydrolase [Mycobacteriales bacterium]
MSFDPPATPGPRWSRISRGALASPLLLAALGTGLAVATGGAAHAATCPSSTTTRVAASGGAVAYSYVRGCITSFDGTPIVYNLFEPTGASARHRVYAVLEGPGWGGAGNTTPDNNLLKADYAYLTWDPRGFGQSGGVAEVDSPLSEGRDVSALITDVLGSRPEIAVDTDRRDSTYGQPAVGMLGASYGGGIQLSSAAFDRRIKAIVPEWAWNNLDYSLYPGGNIKLGWDELLFGAGLAESGAAHAATVTGGTAGTQTGGYDPNIYRSEVAGLAEGYPDQQTLGWFGQRSMASWGGGRDGHVPDVPTLLVQGTVDTLFNLDEAWANWNMIHKADPKNPVKMIAFCGGHVSCPTGNGYSDTPRTGFEKGVPDSTFIENAAINWYDVYLRHDRGAKDTLPTVLGQDQAGTWHALTSFPTAAGPGGATLTKTALSGTVLSTGVPTGTGPNSSIDPAVTDGASPSGDPGTLTVALITHAKADTLIAGEPHIALTVTVDGPSTGLFFKLVDVATNQVVDLQTASYRLDNTDLPNNANNPNLPPAAEKVSLDMVGVVYDLPKGDSLELQVSTSAAPFTPNRGASVVSLSGSLLLPTFQG